MKYWIVYQKETDGDHIIEARDTYEGIMAIVKEFDLTECDYVCFYGKMLS